jgi:hypothetical protein
MKTFLALTMLALLAVSMLLAVRRLRPADEE